MLKRGSFRPAAFLMAIERTVGDSVRHEWQDENLTREVVASTGDIIYLSSGYWRARPVWADDDTLVGVHLVNPDRTGEEIRHVERGIAVLRHLEFV